MMARPPAPSSEPRISQLNEIISGCFVGILFYESRDSAVGIATAYVRDNQGVEVRVPVGQQFSVPHVVRTRCGVHPASYPMGTGGSIPGAKAVGT
jgi:hypothetical protein